MTRNFLYRCLFAAALAASTAAVEAQDDFSAQRARMVADVDAMYAATSAQTGLDAMSPIVRDALIRVPRHRFVPPEWAAYAYANRPLPIGRGQTISQPFIVALSTDLIDPKPQHVVLEVGTGSGYQAAVLAEIVKEVYSIEIVSALGKAARARLHTLGYQNVQIRIGDGYRGWPEHAPFDGIIVTAAAPAIPAALIEQLKPGGKMVIPIGADGDVQHLMLVTRRADGGIDQREVALVRFVPMVPGKIR